MIANSTSTPTKRKGMVYLVGKAARLVTNTSTKGTMAATIRPNDAPFIRIANIVIGKKKAVITKMENPTHPTW